MTSAPVYLEGQVDPDRGFLPSPDPLTEYAARYIQKQAQVGVNSTQYGTGGTPFMRYLKKHGNETTRHRLRNGVVPST